jgi:fermentation-respiration switch protein FrsA (DUF1100 family)
VSAAVLAQWLDLHAATFARQLPPRPVLFMQGQQDRLSPPAAAAALAQALGDGVLAEWVASRHHFEFYDDTRAAADAASATARWLIAALAREPPRGTPAGAAAAVRTARRPGGSGHLR